MPEYDDLNRLKWVLDDPANTYAAWTDAETAYSDLGAAVATVYEYDDAGNRHSVPYPNGTYTIYEYTADNLNRLKKVTNYKPDDTVLSSYTYELGRAGNRTSVVEVTPGGTRTVFYTYDDNYRLVKEDINEPDGSGRLVTYTYDAVGNRLTRTQGFATTTYTYDERDRLTEETTAHWRGKSIRS